MPTRLPFAVLAALLLPLSATAQDDDFVMYLNPAEACDVTQDMDYEERPFRAIHEGGAMLLAPYGMDAIEYNCTFESEIVFDWSETNLQTRAGYCAEPGESIFPQVFVIGMSPSDPDVVRVWSSADQSGEATLFSACRQQN